ncbi:TetR-like C-terminal domain-containing protein [Amnibacterium kyonggiense]
MIRQLLGAAQTDPALWAAVSSNYTLPRRDLAIARLTAARAAGQIRADRPLDVVADQLWGAIHSRLLIPDASLTEQFADDLVDNLLRGVQT